MFGAGILAGVLFLSALGLRPAAAILDPPQQILLRQQLIRHLRKLMTPFMLLPVVASGMALVLQTTSGAWSVQAAGFVFSVLTVVVTVFVNVPLNWRFTGWSSTELPTDWWKYVLKWDRANSLRFVLALAAFACALLSGGK